MEAQEAMHHSLLWGNTVSQEQEKEQAAEQLCEQYISQKVSGVFFAPVEFSANRFQANHRIVAALIELAFQWFFGSGSRALSAAQQLRPGGNR